MLLNQKIQTLQNMKTYSFIYILSVYDPQSRFSRRYSRNDEIFISTQTFKCYF